MIASEVTGELGGCRDCGCKLTSGRFEARGMLFTYCSSCDKYRPHGRDDDDKDTRKENIKYLSLKYQR